jgi:O-antigen/teichoic acid export membrane protein
MATAKGALLMTGSTYVTFFIGLLVNAVTARALGPEDFGRYAYVVWISGLLAMIANNGLNVTGIRFISECLGRREMQSARAVHGWLLRGQWLCLTAAALAFLATLSWTIPVGWREHLGVFIGIVAIGFAAKTMYLFYISIGKGYGQYAVEAFSSITGCIANAACILMLWWLGAPLVAYMALFSAMSVAYGVIAWWMLRSRRILPTGRGLDAELSPRLKNHLGWSVLLTVAAAFGNKASETYLLSVYVGPAELAYFTIATALTRGGVELLSSGLNSVLMPLMGHAYGAGGTSRVNAILADSIRFFSFAGLLLSGVGFLWADAVIVLVYGTQYEPAVVVFRVMSVVAGITLSQGAFGALLSTTDNQRIRAFVALLSVLLSVFVAVLLVPRYGLHGATIATAVSSLVIFLLIGASVIRAFKVPVAWGQLGRLLLAAAVATLASGGCLWLSSNLLVHFVGGLLYAAVFMVCTLVFKAWSESDINLLMPLAHRFPAVFGRLLPAMANRIRRP